MVVLTVMEPRPLQSNGTFPEGWTLVYFDLRITLLLLLSVLSLQQQQWYHLISPDFIVLLQWWSVPIEIFSLIFTLQRLFVWNVPCRWSGLELDRGHQDGVLQKGSSRLQACGWAIRSTVTLWPTILHSGPCSRLLPGWMINPPSEKRADFAFHLLHRRVFIHPLGSVNVLKT